MPVIFKSLKIMIVNSARFVTSSASVEKTPNTTMHEYAFIGRSNVGKSSLINMLTGKKGLAMTSAKPGKTMLINHFLVNDSWYIVDLPGYGYAQRSKSDLAKIDSMIRNYILGRQQMTNLFLLIDSRHEPQRIDLEFMQWLGENGVPFSIVFTKTDKLGPNAVKRNVALYCERLLEEWEELPPVFMTSSEKGTGRDELLAYIQQLNKLPLLANTENNINTPTMDKDTSTKSEAQVNAEQNYSGAAIDAADKDNVTEKEQKERTCTLDFNPHSEGI